MPVVATPESPLLFAGGGEMGALMRATDWSATQFGPVDAWPLSLRTMVGVVLGSRFPMLFWWGPDLLHLYNDAYRPMLTDKHPAALGAPGAQVWAEIWDVVGPMARGVQAGGPATWSEDLELFISTGGRSEARYFTFSYSPVPGDDGRVGGVLGAVQETTAKVLGERQVRLAHDLAARSVEAKSEREAMRIVSASVGTNPMDIPFFLLYTVTEAGDKAELRAEAGWNHYTGPGKPAWIQLDGAESSIVWPLSLAARAHSEVVIDQLSTRFGGLPAPPWGAPPDRAVVLPLGRGTDESPWAFLVAGISPHRTFDEAYRRMFRATADQIANVLVNARAWEAELKRAEMMAEVDRAKTAFFSNVSHEFRTPLTLILGPLEDALGGEKPTLEGDSLLTVHRNATRLLRLVNSLLDFSRIEADRLEMVFVPVDLAGSTAELASSFRSLMERAGLRLVVDCASDLPPAYLDPVQWEKIVLNLLSNAFKFTFAGEVAVTVRADEQYFYVSVSDTGTGIPADDVVRIFERFHRIEGSAGRSFEGTGIGLSLVRDLVTLHGGAVEVVSAVGEGSRFTVKLLQGHSHLPKERVRHLGTGFTKVGSTDHFVLEAASWTHDPPLDAPESPAHESGSRAPQGAVSPLPARILVADDNADMLAYLLRLLRPYYTAVGVADGMQALASARAAAPALILTDAMMPNVDGVELIALLRADLATRHIPIVMISARAGEEAKLAGIATGADDYVVKPFSAAELLARVRTHIALAEARNRAARDSEALAASRAVLVEQLRAKNDELDAFSYAVSHDLRAPIRAIDGFAQAILEESGQLLPAPSLGYLHRVRAAAGRMGQLIDTLLELSRLDRVLLTTREVDLSALAHDVLSEWHRQNPGRRVKTIVDVYLRATADPELMRIALENLLGNACKFTSREPTPTVRFGFDESAAEPCFFVSDNGAGFDPKYADKLFRPFQRLHTAAEFPGTGVGLTTVARIVARHGGRVWAEGALDNGATIRFTLPKIVKITTTG